MEIAALTDNVVKQWGKDKDKATFYLRRNTRRFSRLHYVTESTVIENRIRIKTVVTTLLPRPDNQKHIELCNRITTGM